MANRQRGLAQGDNVEEHVPVEAMTAEGVAVADASAVGKAQRATTKRRVSTNEAPSTRSR